MKAKTHSLHYILSNTIASVACNYFFFQFFRNFPNWIKPNALVSYGFFHSHDTIYDIHTIVYSNLICWSHLNFNTTSLPPSTILRTEFFPGPGILLPEEWECSGRGWRGRGWEAEAGWRPGPGDPRPRTGCGRGLGAPTNRERWTDFKMHRYNFVIPTHPYFIHGDSINKTSKNQSYWSDVLRWCLSKFTVNLSVSTFERN